MTSGDELDDEDGLVAPQVTIHTLGGFARIDGRLDPKESKLGVAADPACASGRGGGRSSTHDTSP
jgi:hypothetical protein